MGKVNKLAINECGIVGRENEVQSLRSLIANTVAGKKPGEASYYNGPDLCLVYGCSGAGKSALVEEALKPSRKGNAVIVSYGKFDQLQAKSIPYSAMQDAMEEVCCNVTDEEVILIKRRLGVDLSLSQHRLLMAVFPCIVGIIFLEENNCFAASELVGMDDHNFEELCHVVKCFLQCLCQEARPMVLCIDDLQWVDLGSLQLLESILADPYFDRLLVIGCYRENEVSEDNSFARTILEVETKMAGKEILRIELGNLALDDINIYVSNLIFRDPKETMELAKVLHDQTSGNPFYCVQLMQKVVDEKAIFYDASDSSWKWDIDGVKAASTLADNVVELVIRKLESLQKDTQQVLQVAACLGCRFNTKAIKSVYDLLQEKAAAAKATSSEEFVKKWGCDRRRLTTILTESVNLGLVTRGDNETRFEFAHDKVQQTVYSGFGHQSEKQKVHLEIGRFLFQSLGEDSTSGDILTATKQLNSGSLYITDRSEKLELASLNLRAARVAKRMSAFKAAQIFLIKGKSLVDRGARWTLHYDLYLELSTLEAQILCSLGEFDEALETANEILFNATVEADQRDAILTRIVVLLAKSKLQECLATGRQFLKSLGESIPKNAKEPHVIVEYLRTKYALRNRTRHSIINQVEMTDQKKLAAVKTLKVLVPVSYLANQSDLFIFLSLRMVRISLQYGMSKYSAFGIGILGVVESSLGKFAAAYSWGQLASQLADRYTPKYGYDIAVTCAVHYFLHHLQNPYQQTIDAFHRSYKTGMASGDIYWAAECAQHYVISYLVAGMPLAPFKQDSLAYVAVFQEYKQDSSELFTRIFAQGGLNLLGESTIDPTTVLRGPMLQDWHFDFSKNGQNPLYRACEEFCKCFAFYILGNHKLAFESAKKVKARGANAEMLDGTHFYVPLYCFYNAMTAISMEKQLIGKEKRAARKIHRSYTKKLESWLAKGVVNVKHKVLLLRAEAALLESKMSTIEIKDLYDKAIAAASRMGHLCDSAIAMERAGVMFQGKGDQDWAAYYLNQSYRQFKDYNATEKLSCMLLQYGSILQPDSTVNVDNDSYHVSLKSTERFDDRSSNRHSMNANELEEILNSPSALPLTELSGN